MEELKDVILHVYKLAPEDTSTACGGFMSKLLPSIGLGAFHTSLQHDNSRYTFSPSGIIYSHANKDEGLPPGATFEKTIALGACRCNRAQTKAILVKLQEPFAAGKYHMVHRNCNHFSETLAMALIQYDEIVDGNKKNKTLATFPSWINRLAKTSHHIVPHDSDIFPCDPCKEAQIAVGAEGRIGWELTSSAATKAPTAASNQKKVLTEKQKAALAKIRGTK